MTEDLPVTSDHAPRFGPLHWAAILVPVYIISALPAWASFTLSPATLAASALLAALLVALSAIDMVELRLPDVLTLTLALLGMALTWLLEWDALALRGAAAVAGFTVFWMVSVLFRRARGYDGLGLGDAKLLGACGTWIGLEALPSLVLIGSVLAMAAVAMGVLLGRPAGGRSSIPFGPFLGIACWIVWLYGAIMP